MSAAFGKYGIPFFNSSGSGGNGTFTAATSITVPAQAGVAEVLLTGKVSDDAIAKFEIKNYTTVDGLFIPSITGTSQGAFGALAMVGVATADTGIGPVTVFDVRTAANAAVAIRPYYDWRNNATSMMQLMPTNAGAGAAMVFSPLANLGPPTFTTRSVGTRLVAYPYVNATGADFAVGMEASGLWFSVGEAPTHQFKWYGGQTLAATLSGLGAMSLSGGLTTLGKVGINIAAPTFGLHQLGGGYRLQALATAATPVITQTGATGAVSYWYWPVPLDQAGNQGTMGAAGTTTTANATLDGTNFETITWAATPGAASYDILRTTSSVAPTGTASVKVGNTTALTLNDQSNTLTSYTVNTGRTADVTVDGRITSSATVQGGGLSTTAGISVITGNVVLTTAASGIQFKSGSNARISTAAGSALVGGSLTIANTSFTANTILLYSVKTDGGTVGNLSYVITAGTGAVFTSTNVLDTSTIVWMAVESN